MLITLTFYQHFTKDTERWRIWNFDDFSARSTIEKERKKVKNVFKTNVLVPREEGATVAATPTFSSAKTVRAVLCGPDGQRSP